MVRQIPSATINEQEAIRLIWEGTAAETGERFFASLVQKLAEVLGTSGAWVTEYLPEQGRLRALALWFQGGFIDGYEYDVAGTPCEPVITEQCLYHVPDGLQLAFPKDPDLTPMNAHSYMGIPLFDTDNSILGHLAVLDDKPMPKADRTESLFRIFAARAGAEMRRLRADTALREREEKIRLMVNSAMDVIIELDANLTVTRVNRAAKRTFCCEAQGMGGHPITDFFSSESATRLRRLSAALQDDPEGRHYLWVPGGLQARTLTGELFPSEGSIARFESKGHPFYTIILRNINDRVESEQRIKSLARETAYLREELNAAFNTGRTIGSSAPMRALCKSVQQVAPTDSTVLILGETGTGKELTAREIHAGSRRAEKPLVRVNCAAIPASLIESEFFGHEKGAFTGATARREGRFALADGGTIFLDEIGELPIDLQPKLLRVLQEGEFEPVGSSDLRTVDVRVIAATNRDLKKAITEGRFREDLYYRLNVFPVSVPPLRERGDDVIALAEAFADTFAKTIGRSLQPFSPDDIARMKGYAWPGNVRELRNVIERAVITAADGRLNLAGLLATSLLPSVSAPTDSHENGHVLTADEFRDLERANIIRALERCDGKVSGADGAAALMKIAPSTLFSRIKALDIERSS